MLEKMGKMVDKWWKHGGDIGEPLIGIVSRHEKNVRMVPKMPEKSGTVWTHGWKHVGTTSDNGGQIRKTSGKLRPESWAVEEEHWVTSLKNQANMTC